jgi:hypothetical protein
MSSPERRRGRTARAARASLVLALAFGLAGLGCRREPAKKAVPSAAASASAITLPAPVASGLPDAAYVSAIVNPDGVAAYSGPAGTVRGRVVVTGDAPPDLPAVLAKIPSQCGAGREAYGKLFREGPGRALADALVAVTGYKGYVPEQESSVRLEAKGCFFGTKTIAMTLGQRLEVVSKDAEAYVPELLGERGQAQLVAVPGASSGSSIYPTKIGRFVLVDNLKLFMVAEVLVLKYPTHAVTGLDGRFEIPNVPAGPAVVSALLPATGASVTKAVTVEAGKPTEEVVFELAFDRAGYAARTAGGAPSASAAPAASGAPRPKGTTAAPNPASSR